MPIAYAIQLLNALLQLLPAGTALFEKYTANKAQLVAMKAQNRVPTDAEWTQLNADVSGLEAQLDAAAAARGP